MSDVKSRRDEVVSALRDKARELLPESAIERTNVEAVAAGLRELAADTTLWSEAEFPPPEGDEKQARYLIAQDDGQTYALYLNVMKPGKKIPPHNHTTWACVAAVDGVELNTLYRRIDGGTEAGHAELEPVREVAIAPGIAIGMMPEDIHSVFIPGDSVIRHLHFYGRALETLSQRLMFNMEDKTCRVMDVGVRTRVAR
ncbi:MAG: cysteine dioxygenase family protein [Mesorhizobium sp.]|nr:cysteine dioxygenase family protein [Mesorhizobium sp.]